MSRIFVAFMSAFMLFAAGAATAETGKDSNRLLMETSKGPVLIEMRPDLAPKHVAQIKTLVERKFYDNIIFHRVIDGFMAQTGDPQGTGMGGSDLPNIPAEFSSENFSRGVVGMARANDPDSANSQFFIMFADGAFLNNNYTIWGRVVAGMENIDKINRGEPPANPDKIISMRLLPSDE